MRRAFKRRLLCPSGNAMTVYSCLHVVLLHTAADLEVCVLELRRYITIFPAIYVGKQLTTFLCRSVGRQYTP